MANPTLAMIPSGYKAGKVYSVLPVNGDGDFTTFTRAGQATRVNQSGFIETVDANIPRLDYTNGGCPVLLLEDQKVNNLTYSDDFNNWTKTNITTTTNTTLSPSGDHSADTITRNSTAASYVNKSFTKEDEDSFEMTLSVFVKKNIGDFFAIRAQGIYPHRVDTLFQFSNETLTSSESGNGNFSFISASFTKYSNDWYRLNVSFETDEAATLTTLFSPRSLSGQVDSTDSASDSSVFIWGAQCEYDSLTSYIKTTTVVQTRLKETCKDGGNSVLFNGNYQSELLNPLRLRSTYFENLQGTTDILNSFLCDSVLTYGSTMFVDLQKSLKDRTLGRISISDSSTSNAVVISKKTNNSQFYLFITRANGDIVAEITTNVDYDVRNKIAISWEVDNFKFYVNGFLVHTVTSGETPIDLNAFAFNGSNESLFNFFGEINTVQYYNSSLQNLEIEKLTSYSSFSKMAESQLCEVQ